MPIDTRDLQKEFTFLSDSSPMLHLAKHSVGWMQPFALRGKVVDEIGRKVEVQSLIKEGTANQVLFGSQNGVSESHILKGAASKLVEVDIRGGPRIKIGMAQSGLSQCSLILSNTWQVAFG